MLAFVIVQLSNYAIFALLAWRIETLPTLDEAEADDEDVFRPERRLLAQRVGRNRN